IGQDIQYYKNLADTAENKSIRLAAIDSVLIRSYSTNLDDFIEYSIQYINLALAEDEVENAAKKAMNLQYPLTIYGNDPLNAITIINSVLARKYKITDSLLLGGLYLKRGSANAKIDLKNAVEDFNMALQNF